jgi:predicted RNA-binding protein with PUA-like domain
MKRQAWLVKQEPESYCWDDFVRDGKTVWDGVRSYPARLNLKKMARGDEVLFYASGGPKAVMGRASVAKTAFADPSADKTEAEEGWVAVLLKAGAPLPHPVTLQQIKAEPALKNIMLLRQSRLSVMPLTAAEFDRIVELGT